MADRDKTPNAREADNPGITVTAPLSREEAFVTTGGAQKSEAWYRKQVQKGADDGDQAVYSNKRRK
jgi:hypothetical protein